VNEQDAIKAVQDRVEIECFEACDPEGTVARGKIAGYQFEPSVLFFDELRGQEMIWPAHLTRVASPKPCCCCGLYPDGSKS